VGAASEEHAGFRVLAARIIHPEYRAVPRILDHIINGALLERRVHIQARPENKHILVKPSHRLQLRGTRPAVIIALRAVDDIFTALRPDIFLIQVIDQADNDLIGPGPEIIIQDTETPHSDLIQLIELIHQLLFALLIARIRSRCDP